MSESILIQAASGSKSGGHLGTRGSTTAAPGELCATGAASSVERTRTRAMALLAKIFSFRLQINLREAKTFAPRLPGPSPSLPHSPPPLRPPSHFSLRGPSRYRRYPHTPATTSASNATTAPIVNPIVSHITAPPNDDPEQPSSVARGIVRSRSTVFNVWLDGTGRRLERRSFVRSCFGALRGGRVLGWRWWTHLVGRSSIGDRNRWREGTTGIRRSGADLIGRRRRTDAPRGLAASEKRGVAHGPRRGYGCEM